MEFNIQEIINDIFILRAVAILFIVIAAIFMVLQVTKQKTIFKGQGIKNEISYVSEVRRRDAEIIKINNFMRFLTNIVENSPLALSKSNLDYYEYNITRASIKVFGGFRDLKPVEFNAVIKLLTIFSVLISVVVALLFSVIFGVVMLVVSVVVAGTFPMMFIRQIVKDKDDEVVQNFSDFYLMLHYVLMEGSKTPLINIMRSYAKTTTSKEMIKLVDTCVHYIETYGEYEATKYISKNYREIHVLTRLMRIIKQVNEGADVKTELAGFRAEVLRSKRYMIEMKVNKLVMKAKLSFYVLTPILIQAILSAMSIYFPDIGVITGLVS